MVLIADHDRTSRTVSRLILQQSGYKVIEATNGRQCILLYSQYQPDLILLDFDLPDLNGLTCCHEIRYIRRDTTTPIVVLTALDDRETIEKAFSNGANDYILKPMHPCILQKRINHLLEIRASEAKLRRSEERYRSVISNLQEIVFQTDLDGVITYVNPAWSKVTGFSVRDVVGSDLYKFIHPVDLASAKESFSQLLNGEATECRFQARYFTHEQEVRWLNFYACQIKNNNGSTDSISGTLEDITNLKIKSIQVDLERKIHKILAASESLDQAMSQILQAMCMGLDWEYGELWLPAPEDGEPLCMESWYFTACNKNKELESLGYKTDPMASIYHPMFNISSNIIQQLWSENSLSWNTSIMPASNSTQGKSASSYPNRSMLSIPIFDSSKPLGIMLFFQRGYHPVDENLLKRLGSIGNQIGNFMMRKRAEEKVVAQHYILHSELQQAADYVRSLLPHPIDSEVSLCHQYIPSNQLGGDAFDYYWLDSENLVIYLLDVSGHGIRSALLSVSILNLLRHQSLQNADFLQPTSVLNELNQKFQMNVDGEDYFTIWYGVYNVSTSTLTYSSAGHPPALLISEDNSLSVLKTGGLAVGMFPGISYKQKTCKIEGDSFLYVFSDGIYEILTNEGSYWGINDFTDLLSKAHLNNQYSINGIISQVSNNCAHQSFEDDCSLIQAKF